MAVSPRLSTRVSVDGLRRIDDTATDMGVKRSEAARRLLLVGLHAYIKHKVNPGKIVRQ
jgi:hypothetical protein